MEIIKQEGTFKVENFGGIIYDSKGAEVPGANYTVIAPNTANGTVTSPFIISGISALLIEKGDVVDITGTDGIIESYVVTGVGVGLIKVDRLIDDVVGSTVVVANKVYTITLGSEIEEGQYNLDTNEVIIVANTFSNAYINRALLQNRYSNLSSKFDTELLNKDAKEELLADFALKPTFYKSLDSGSITALLKRKILSNLELADKDRDANNMPLTLRYDKLVREVVTFLNTYLDNTANADITSLDEVNALKDKRTGWGNRA